MSESKKSFFQYLGLPGLISMGGLATGWLAMVLLFKGFPFLAISAAILAFFLDCLDGHMARKTQTESEFGRQLDSLFDFFNYSVFSALLFWLYILPNLLGIFVGFVILAAGAFRLVRFNIEGYVIKNEKRYYEGIVVCQVSLAAILLFLSQQIFPLVVTLVSAPIMLVVSSLQVSRIPMRKSKTYKYWLTLAFLLFVVSLGFQLWLR